MPIYVYERPDGSRFEIRQGFNDPHLIEDPETGVPVRRVLQPAPIIFKGSGWYKTDSRTDNRATAAPKTEASTSDAATTGTGTTSDKAAEKSTETTTKTTAEAAPTKPSAEAKKSADKIAAAAS
jgi:predicted nucleic acid-binding Zn ribbon protein